MQQLPAGDDDIVYAGFWRRCGALILDLRTLRDDGVLASALSGMGR